MILPLTLPLSPRGEGWGEGAGLNKRCEMAWFVHAIFLKILQLVSIKKGTL
jgi:hypothetical protein